MMTLMMTNLKKVFISSKSFVLSACPSPAGYFNSRFLRQEEFPIIQKIPCTVNQTVQRTYVYAVPPRLFCAPFAAPNHSFDCNASQRTVLGPLRAGFQILPEKALSALGASLCYLPHSTLLFNVLFSILLLYLRS